MRTLNSAKNLASSLGITFIMIFLGFVTRKVFVETSVCQHLALGGWRTDQPTEPTYSLKYKLTWCFLLPFKKLLGKFSYVSMKVA